VKLSCITTLKSLIEYLIDGNSIIPSLTNDSLVFRLDQLPSVDNVFNLIISISVFIPSLFVISRCISYSCFPEIIDTTIFHGIDNSLSPRFNKN
jgi:hypothetical protein